MNYLADEYQDSNREESGSSEDIEELGIEDEVEDDEDEDPKKMKKSKVKKSRKDVEDKRKTKPSTGTPATNNKRKASEIAGNTHEYA